MSTIYAVTVPGKEAEAVWKPNPLGTYSIEMAVHQLQRAAEIFQDLEDKHTQGLPWSVIYDIMQWRADWVRQEG